MHGAFTWAWIRAMRDAVAGETAEETFLRAQARLRGETPYQAPAMLGRAEARRSPFLGTRAKQRGERTIIAVESVQPDGQVVLQGGWAHGLAVDSELSPIGDRLSRLHVTRLLGLGRSLARVSAGSAGIGAGGLLEIVGWAAPPERPLRVCAPTENDLSTDGVLAVSNPRDADYVLTRTAWTDVPMQLRRDLVTLRRIRSWLSLASPPDTPTPYRLAVRDERTTQLVGTVGTVAGHRVYSIVLRASSPSPEPLIPRYYYVFVVDSHGNSHLVFPRTGSSENRFPIGDRAPAEIPLGAASAFRITPPYGIDTYFLLSTEEPLPNPSILEWDGVRARRALPTTPWSIERLTLQSVAPDRRASVWRRPPSAVGRAGNRELHLDRNRHAADGRWRPSPHRSVTS
jgi:hypothetical protein